MKSRRHDGANRGHYFQGIAPLGFTSPPGEVNDAIIRLLVAGG